jgi:two-component system sensor histidine kinase DegS
MQTLSSLLPRFREMIAENEKEREQVEVEMREIDILLKQTAGEIEKLQVRQTDAASKLRTVEANLESYPATDIRMAYAGAQDAQMRLFMMRSQLEQLQNKQRALVRYQNQLAKVGNLGAQILEVAPPPGTTAVTDGAVSDHQAIVNIIEAQENERQRLSRQMHDGPAQSLTNLILQTEIVERTFDADPARAKAELSNLKNAANATFQRIRDFIFDLRPMMLDDLGLLPTLKRYLQTFESKSHIATPIIVQGERSLSPYIEVTLYRAIQELLNNVARHAHATHAQVSIDLGSEPIFLYVEDDGSGFDVESALASAKQRGGSGLINLQKRIEMLGGHIQIQSGTGRGTRVSLQVPTK